MLHAGMAPIPPEDDPGFDFSKCAALAKENEPLVWSIYHRIEERIGKGEGRHIPGIIDDFRKDLDILDILGFDSACIQKCRCACTHHTWVAV